MSRRILGAVPSAVAARRGQGYFEDDVIEMAFTHKPGTNIQVVTISQAQELRDLLNGLLASPVELHTTEAGFGRHQMALRAFEEAVEGRAAEGVDIVPLLTTLTALVPLMGETQT